MQRACCVSCNSIVSLVVGLAILLAAPAALAQTGAPSAPPAGASQPTCEGEAFRAFDFWLGRWEVSIADGRRAGENLITATDDGCLLLERWNGVGGTSGVSMNFYDAVRDAWRQVWVSNGGTIDISGGLVDGAMVLEGEIHDRASGETRPFRGTWAVLPDGRVRQFFEEHRDGGWQPWFEGFYAKVVE